MNRESEYWHEHERRATSTCPMDNEQVTLFLKNQEVLMQKMERIEKYLFAGRVAVAAVATAAMSVWWVRDHFVELKSFFDASGK